MISRSKLVSMASFPSMRTAHRRAARGRRCHGERQQCLCHASCDPRRSSFGQRNASILDRLVARRLLTRRLRLA